MFFVLADANTSAGAPCTICCASPELGPKLNTTFTPGCAASNCFPSVLKASVSDAAANTLTVPLMDCAEVLAGDEPPQPPTATAHATADAASAPPRRVTA